VSNLPAKPFAISLVAGRSGHVPLLAGHRPSRLVALDFETAAPYDHIVEIGAVEIVDGALTGRTFHRLVRPRVPIDGFTAVIHGITDRKVAGKPYFADTVSAFLDFLGDAPIVAHAAHVERTILERELNRLGQEALPRTRFLCTLSMARQSRRFLRNGLRDLCEAMDITVKAARNGFHDALGDAEMAALIYMQLVEPGIFVSIPVKRSRSESA
jgi:DNA polymerase III subunit epsilon